MTRHIPLLNTLRGYDRGLFRDDVIAGLTTAVMLIPQSMGYAMLAGLPPITGLYASLLPLVIYGFFGTSRQLAVGPVAMVSLLVAGGVGAIAEPGTASFVAYAIMLSLGVGVLQLAMGVGRLGFLVNFLSHPVISGFTSAAAIIIGFSQLQHLLGVAIPRSHHVHELLISAAKQAAEIHPITLGIGLAAVAALVLLKRRWPRFPRALAVVVVSTLAVWGFDLHAHGVAIVGSVPSGLPTPKLPAWDTSAMSRLFGIALTISLVGFMESIAVAKRYARENGYAVDANRELIGLGLANLGGALTQAYPVTGGFSRTAVNASAGARTGLAGILTAFVVGVTLLFFTPLFHFLPKAVLAAIIVTAVVGLVDVHEVTHLWRVKRSDLLSLAVTFASTLLLGIEQGILVGVGLSLALLVAKSTRPHAAVLGRLPGTEVWRNVDRFPEAETVDGVLVVRLDAQIYFGNVNFLEERLVELEEGRALHAVVLDASGVNQIDASGEAAVRELAERYHARSVRFGLASLKGPVRDVLGRSGLLAELVPQGSFLRVEDAVVGLTEGRAAHPAAGQYGTSEPDRQADGPHAPDVSGLGTISLGQSPG
jgi:sulfate permease, SulP family